MGGREELEIEIDEQGRVHVVTKGLKGPACLEYAKVFQELLGPVVEQRLTHEYYEQPPDVRIGSQAQARGSVGRGSLPRRPGA